MAYDGLFSILDEKYITSINELPNSSSSDLKPDENWSTQGTISGWVDIVGFRQMVREDGIDYVPNDSLDLAIVKYDVTSADLKGKGMSRIPHMDSRWSCYWCEFDNLSHNLIVTHQGNQTVAILNATLNWHETVLNSGTNNVIRYTDTASFTDSEVSPQIYNPYIADVCGNVTEYNNTLFPKTAIYLPTAPNITQATYQYKSEELTHILKWAKVERTEKGVFFVNLTTADFWTKNTDNLHHMSEWVVIPNSSRPDYANLTIMISNLYESRNVENASITRITYKPENTFSLPVLWFLTTIGTFLYLLQFIIKRNLHV